MASTKEDFERITHVVIDGLVVLKICKHCQEEGTSGELVQGVLLGLIKDNRLEITNSFPFLDTKSEEDDQEEMQYQIEMMRRLRAVNVDHLHVGWYQSTYLGSFFNRNFLDSQYSYQKSIEESIVLVYDPYKTSQGMLSLRAFRLSKNAMNMNLDSDYTPDSLRKSGLTFHSMFEEIPLMTKSSTLSSILSSELDEQLSEPAANKFLGLGSSVYLEKQVRLLMECVDELNQDVNKYHNYQRSVVRQQQQKDQYLQKKAAEGGSRKKDDEDINKLFKPNPAPSRLDNMLISGQINNYCSQINQFSSHNFGKLFLAEAFQQQDNAE